MKKKKEEKNNNSTKPKRHVISLGKSQSSIFHEVIDPYFVTFRGKGHDD